ncbi:zinc finger BED domain-containing protein RICESLEEPER 2-like isoform X2 [Setaria viridis]|uniref:zinc finger BED domain-containing protein RICESLEEPER 2-like isoform X2 n=1 Tax=Setaria viridis TaxID=4556 RepID=UPI0014933CE4|nr:zinc finger BED domain-containing protein RICESLEEPER 2-like isoform X2 [Setaria viridis]
MEEQSDHPHHEHGMADQAFRPLTSLLLSAPAVAREHASSSSDNNLPSLPSLSPPDDGYIWKKCAQNIVPGCGYPTVYYKCTQEGCEVNKLVVCSADGHQVFETVLSGCHNHPRPRDAPAGFDGGEQLSSSSDSEEDNDIEAGVEEDVAGDSSAIERHVPAPADRITAQTGTRYSHRQSKSKVWEEFTAVLRGGKIQSAECKHCKRLLSGTSTGRTTHLRQHLKICPARPATGRMQQQRSSPHPGSTVDWKSDQDRSLEFLTRAFVSNLFSPPLTSSATFRQFWAGICPTNNAVSQGAIEEKFLSIFQNEKTKLKEEIALAPGGVFLTVKKSYLDTKHFIILAVHFIDKEWNLNRKIIGCCFSGCDIDAVYYVSLSHCFQSSRNFTIGDWKAVEEEKAKEAVQNWSLEWKLLGIISPNPLGHLGDTAVSTLEKNLTEQNYLLAKCKLLHLPCIIDALHDFFGYELNEYVLTTSQSWCEYMTCSPLRKDKYKEILSRMQISRPSFGSQRWYLIFYALEAALQFNNELPNPQQIDYKSYPSKPSYAQLQAAENFCDLGRSIYHAIKVISRPGNATLNSHFHAIWNLKIALRRSSSKENIDQVLDIERMQLKFDQLWRKWYLWLSLAVVLDPRYKIRFLVICFKEAFGSHAKKYILEVRGKLYELFLQYSFHVDQQNCENFNQRNNDLQLDIHGSLPVTDTSQSYIEQAAHEELGEVITYLEGELIPQNVCFDVLKWWKENASIYPTLARLARDILAIPASTVSAESAFDENDERMSLFNQKLSPELVEALICTQDWIKSSETNDIVGGNRNMPA